jgi:hypothetical protein
MQYAGHPRVDEASPPSSFVARASFCWIVLSSARQSPSISHLIQGYRMITGQSQGSMMVMVTNMARIVVIVTVATSMSIFGGSLQTFLSANGTLASEISQLVAGTNSPINGIDQNMAETQLALAAINLEMRQPDAVRATSVSRLSQRRVLNSDGYMMQGSGQGQPVRIQ